MITSNMKTWQQLNYFFCLIAKFFATIGHITYNSTRLSPDSITMEKKLYDPSMTSMHLVLNDIFDVIFIDEEHTFLEKTRKPIQPRVAAVLHTLSFFRNQVVLLPVMAKYFHRVKGGF